MKTLILALIAVMSFSVTSIADDSPPVQIPIGDVMFPEVGYDDNDIVELVVDGKLQSPCYQLGRTEVHRNGDVFFVNQYAQFRDIEPCDKDLKKLPVTLRWPLHFTTTVRIGKLSRGSYKVVFRGEGLTESVKTLNVKESTTASIDDVLYAPISSVFVPEVLLESPTNEVALTGVIQRSCLRLNDEVKVEKIGNVIVVLPTLDVLESPDCDPVTRPIQKIVDLGKLEPGRYLLHVRSTAGRAVNRTFSVIKPSGDPSMNRSALDR